jgi:hypothetical protein
MIRRLALAIAFLVATLPAMAADVRVPLTTGGALVLPVPAGWKYVRQSGDIPTIALTPESGNAFVVLVSPLVRADGVTAPADADSLRSFVSSGAQKALAQSIEKSLPVQDLRGGNAQGSYFSATDRAPKPGEFKYLTQGAVAIQGLPVSFTVLSNGDPQVATEPTFRMLKAARRE